MSFWQVPRLFGPVLWKRPALIQSQFLVSSGTRAALISISISSSTRKLKAVMLKALRLIRAFAFAIHVARASSEDERVTGSKVTCNVTG